MDFNKIFFLKNEINIERYFFNLKLLKNNIGIALSIKDTAGNSLPIKVINLIKELGFTEFTNNLWIPYAGLILNNKIIINESGYDGFQQIKKSYFFKKRINVSLGSASYKNGNKSEIIINGYDFSVNERGLNIVIFNANDGFIFDSINFDGHEFYDPNNIKRKSVDKSKEILKHLNNFEAEIQQIKYETNLNLLSLYRYNVNRDKIDSFAKTRFIYMPKAEGDLRLIQKASSLILHKIDYLCLKHDIKYFASAGTLIGALRHNGFIPWDDDIDICMMKNDFNKFKSIIQRESDIYINCIYTYNFSKPEGLIYWIRVMAKNVSELVFVDIFLYDYCDDFNEEYINKYFTIRDRFKSESLKLNLKLEKSNEYIEKFIYENNQFLNSYMQKYNTKKYIYRCIENFSTNLVNKTFYSSDDIFPLLRVKFENFEINVPNKSLKIANQLYDNIYEIPKDCGMNKHLNKRNKLSEIEKNKIVKFIIK